ncbi:uncharacterized protein ARMOST_17584 [Armillaria ostoyae]|uniref:F-box domain-containing protein n=1 Tax=Armillaria ostoyae TaxID=47428 RepID=A0A284RZF4_ARMOS|nr:uncharacterized protein ARMOST_17584 [Armillaria ostoyae]
MTTLVKNTVPGGSRLSMPQELIDFTLDFLHDDIPTLRACSLVSRAFLPCSRYHIYSNVFIVHVRDLDIFREQYAGQVYQCQNLAALLEHSPHLAPLVRRFGIHGKSWMTNVLKDTSLFPTIQSLRNLSHLEFISSTTRGRFPVETYSLFLAALRSPSLKTLILKGINFQNDGRFVFEDAFTAAAANPALKHLSLVDSYRGGVETSEPYPPIRPPPSGLPALESLSISGTQNISRLFFTQYLYSISGIRRLSLQMDPVTPCSLIQSLLNEMQETLECFTLDIDPKIRRQVGLDLSRHRNLSSLYTIVPDFFPGLYSVPEMRLNPTLRTLTVEHVSRPNTNSVEYSLRVCAEVDRLALPALEHVHIRRHVPLDDRCYYWAACDCEVQWDAEDLDGWRRQVEESMPLLKDRGILEVELTNRRYIVFLSDRADVDLFPVARGNDYQSAFA